MVALTVRKELASGDVLVREAGVSKHLPYTRHVDPRTIATRDGYLLQVIKVDGYSFETADQSDLNQLKNIRATLLRSIADNRFGIYHHVVRRTVDQYPEGYFENDFCRNLDNVYRASLAGRRLFVNEQYLTVIRRPARSLSGKLTTLTRSVFSKVDRRIEREREAVDLKGLNDAVRALTRTLSPYGAKVLEVNERDGIHYSDPLSFLSYLVNYEMVPVRLPRMSIAETIPRKRLSFGKETIELRGSAPTDVRYSAVMSIRDYERATGPGMLDDLLRQPHEFVITQSYGFVDREGTKSRMKDVQRRMASAEDGATSLEVELLDAIDEVASGKAAFGEHHLTVTPIASNASELDASIADIGQTFINAGITTVRESVNLEAGFWAQLPGNFAYVARRSLISTSNFSGFASLHTFPSGKLHGNHWGEPISLLETTSGSPYWFSFHDRDIGNFTLIGPTGGGKTVLMSFLVAQAQRVRPVTVYFDKDRGAEIFIRAMGGDYTIVRRGQPTGLNPLQLDDTAVNRAFLREWLASLVRTSDEALPPHEDKVISEAVAANFDLPREQRRLSVLAELFVGHEKQASGTIADRLAKWHSGGDLAWLFDNETDTLSLSNKTLGFDLTSILDDKVSRTPWLLYVFHRVDELLNGQKVMLMLDEGWKLLDDRAFAERIKDWEKTIRKRNGLLGFATQSAKDVLESHVGTSIIEQSPTNIFLPNPKADTATYIDGFGLSLAEYKFIKETPESTRLFLVRHGRESVIATLNLNGLDAMLGVLSGRTETLNMVDQLREELGDDPAGWLPVFMERMER